jgi:hypothetical protein
MSTIPIPWYHGMENPYHTHSFQYHVTIPYHVTLYHTIWPHTIPYHHSKGVWGPFSKYINYFCWLQYWSVGCHLLWKGSSGFCWDFKLQMEARW